MGVQRQEIISHDVHRPKKGRGRLRDLNYSDLLTGKSLVFWKRGRQREVIAYYKWSHKASLIVSRFLMTTA